ncbi:MAG TPA: alpha,alpha-trehalase TreF [Chitinophagaceae bacterium]|nr:alpha,alpha-trehalase TreF [Chitinophagaceae bacterium]
MMSTMFFIESLNELFIDVQSKEIFHDSKYFVDCIPKFSVDEILKKYALEKNTENFDLKLFIAENFLSPAEIDSHYTSSGNTIQQHIEQLWTVLKRNPDAESGTLIPLPNSYIVPGGRFREVYYWDTYFTMLGLQISKQIDLIEHMVENFSHLIHEIGFIPNGNRTYYLGRSQPPFFSLMVKLLSEEKSKNILLKYTDALEKEYRFWMDGEDKLSQTNNNFRRVVLLPDGSVLNRYWDDYDTPRPEAYAEDVQIAKLANTDAAKVYRDIRAAAESGWDFSSRWFKEPGKMQTIQTTELIPVDLNCLMLHLEETLLQIFELKNEKIKINSFKQKIQQRKKSIQTFCWNKAVGFYFDYHFLENKQTLHYNLAAAYPLFFSVSTQEQSNKVAAIIEEKFLQSGGVVTTIQTTGQQWDAPNGWAPLQWITYKGLTNFNHHSLAKKIKQNWMSANEKVYVATGKMMEKYNVMDTSTKAGDGEYPNQDGFGWTNAVYLKLMNE